MRFTLTTLALSLLTLTSGIAESADASSILYVGNVGTGNILTFDATTGAWPGVDAGRSADLQNQTESKSWPTHLSQCETGGF